MTYRVEADYAGVSCYFDHDFNHPPISDNFTADDFSREYDAAFDILAEELSTVGTVDANGFGDGDFSMSRYVDLNRSITAVAYTPTAQSPAAISAAHTALQRLSEEYVFCFDAHPSYICVRRDGIVIGHTTNGDFSVLRAFGFPTAIA